MSRSSERAGRPVRVAASILSADFAALGEAVEQARAGGVDWIHLDVMDGHFVPNLSFGPAMCAALRARAGIFTEVHLMVANPERLLEEYVAAGVDSVTIHAEATPHAHRLLGRIRELGARAGLALNPGTPLALAEDLVDRLDLLLVMTVDPGFGSQPFLPGMLPKIARARALLDAAGSPAALEVDGGIGPETAAAVTRAGADVLVSGSALYGGTEGVGAAVAALRRAAEGG